MRIPLAWKTLLHTRWRTFLAIAGITFAIMLMFLQLGFFASVLNSATQLTDALEFDLVVRSPDYTFLPLPGSFPERRVHQARAVHGVAEVVPFYIDTAVLVNPEGGHRQEVFLMACDPRFIPQVCRDAEVLASAGTLSRPDCALIDRASRSSYGPQERGRILELNRREIRLEGQYSMGVGFIALAAMFMSDQNLLRVAPHHALEDVSMGLILLEPGADARAVQARLRSVMPADTQVLTRQEMEEHEKDYWVNRSSTGIVFGSGVVIAFIVGIVILYQTLSSQIASLLGEFATLKAIGYPPSYLTGVVLQQAVFLAAAGFVPGFLLANVLYLRLAAKKGLLIFMTLDRTLAVLAMVLVMSSLSGIAALRKVHGADPADLF